MENSLITSREETAYPPPLLVLLSHELEHGYGVTQFQPVLKGVQKEQEEKKTGSPKNQVKKNFSTTDH